MSTVVNAEAIKFFNLHWEYSQIGLSLSYESRKREAALVRAKAGAEAGAEADEMMAKADEMYAILCRRDREEENAHKFLNLTDGCSMNDLNIRYTEMKKDENTDKVLLSEFYGVLQHSILCKSI